MLRRFSLDKDFENMDFFSCPDNKTNIIRPNRSKYGQKNQQV